MARILFYDLYSIVSSFKILGEVYVTPFKLLPYCQYISKLLIVSMSLLNYQNNVNIPLI